MKRVGPLKRVTPLRSRSRLRPVSKKRQRENRVRSVVRAEVLERDGNCQARDLIPRVACGGPLDVHELVRRSQWRAGILDPSNCLVLCRWHHSYVTEHPELAHELGLSRWSWEREAS